jgi:hypothetical protein
MSLIRDVSSYFCLLFRVVFDGAFLRAHEIMKWQNRSLTLKTISIRPLMALAVKQRIEDANCIFLPLLGV